MRLLEVAPDGSPGGGATLVLGLVRHFARHAEVHLATEGGSYLAERAAETGATVHGMRLMGSRFDRSASRAILRTVRATTPDVVHLHGGRAMFYGAEAIRATDTPCVYTVHGYHFQRKSTPMRLAGMLAERRAARWADVVVFVCEEDRRLGRSLGLIGPDQRTEVVYNGIDTAGMPDATPPAQACVCFFGRLVVQKDPLLMVEIAAILAREGVRTRFVGGGEMEREVRERAKALGLPIEITGALPRDQALRELAKCSAMVMPSRWEGLPIAISEALAIGVPVIAANVNGVPEIVEDGVDGRLVSSREPEAFASAVRDILGDPVARAKMIAAGKRAIAERFSWDRCMAAHEALYRSVVKA